jgi:hypothetical protein
MEVAVVALKAVPQEQNQQQEETVQAVHLVLGAVGSSLTVDPTAMVLRQ